LIARHRSVVVDGWEGWKGNAMPFVEAGELTDALRAHGDKEPVLVFSNSLGTDFSMWDPQMEELQRRFRILRYDTRGHGQSSVTPGDYTIELLGRDVLGLLDSLRLDRVHFCGLSMGGMIGMWLGIHAPTDCIAWCSQTLGLALAQKKGGTRASPPCARMV
jgi:pimeloyl-ACP methyl ester carboxylesterase